MRLNTADCSAVVALRFVFTFQSESVLSVLFVVKEERGNKKKQIYKFKRLLLACVFLHKIVNK